MRTVYPTRLFLLLSAAGLLPAGLPVLAGKAWWLLPAAGWAALLAGLLLDAWALSRAGRLVRAEWEDRVGVGDSIQAELELESRLPFPLGGEVLLEVSPPLEEGGKGRFQLLPGRTLVGKEIGAPKRGEGTLEAAWIAIRGPLGLLRRVRRHPLEGKKVRVLPNLAKVRRMLLAFAPAGPARGGLVRVSLRGEAGEFDALESYVPGMDSGAVDWKASARHQALVVRRFRLERNQRVVLVLDTGRLMGEVLEGLERLDHAVHGALLLAWAVLKAGDRVGVYSYGEKPGKWLPPGGGRGRLGQVRHLLGELRVEGGETNHAWGLRELARKLPRRSIVVVFTEFTDPAMAALMVENAGALALRHQVLFVVMEDPALDAALDEPPSGKEETARGLVALRIRWERNRVLHRLSSLGVRVVRGSPERAALAAVKGYVRLKKGGVWA